MIVCLFVCLFSYLLIYTPPPLPAMTRILCRLVFCSYCDGNALRVRRGSLTIWSNRRTLNPKTLLTCPPRHVARRPRSPRATQDAKPGTVEGKLVSHRQNGAAARRRHNQICSTTSSCNDRITQLPES